jgi:hypothetical protein
MRLSSTAGNMHLLSSLIENLMIMVLTVVALVGSLYVLLLILNFWMKFKSGGREDEGLTAIWNQSLSHLKSDHKKDPSEE